MLKTCCENVRKNVPLVHNITNYVTVNDVANVILACGGSPIMSDEPEDVVDITSICSALNINIGTLHKTSIEAMVKAGKKSNELGHPVLLDPVGAGASALRTNTAVKLMKELKLTVIRGNISEIKTLALGSGTTKGVDADVADKVTDETLDDSIRFVKNFAKSYYTWSNSKEAIKARTQAINEYLTKELQDLNVDTIRTDIPTSSTVTDVIIWDVEQAGEDDFIATYEVDQQIKENDQTRNVSETYTVKVHVDENGDMVIIQNPTLAPAIQKSEYEPKKQEGDASVDADTTADATAFLETFFKLYPTATETELAYYVAGNVLEPINGDYIYSELVNPVFTKDGDNVKVKVAVKFLDNQTKATQMSQYELVLHKDSNWKIVG